MNLDDYRLSSNEAESPPPAKAPTAVPRHAKGEWFVKGPLPGLWLEAASQLPGKALHVGLAIWYLSGLRGSPTVALAGAARKKFGLGAEATSGGLKKLEAAGLISVTRRPGAAPRVTLMAAMQDVRRCVDASAAST